MKAKSFVYICLSLIILGAANFSFAASNDEPEMDRKALIKFFQNKFPDVKFGDYKDGVYALSADAKMQFEAMNLIPPYEFDLEKGEKLFKKKFKNGKSYSTCIKSGLLRERSEYPYFDTNKKTVKTLELEVNECRKANNEKPLKYKKGDMANLSAFISTRSEGKKMNVAIPNDDALAAYRSGKKFYYAKRGYLNNSCANCHINYAGNKARSELMHTTLGEATGWPTYRTKWGNLGTLHRRLAACHRDQGAKPLKGQSEIYRNVEYFIGYLSNGLEFDAPSVRK